MAKNAATIYVSVCPICDTQFQYLGFKRYCSPKCTKIAGRIKSKSKQNTFSVLCKCSRCKTPFASVNSESDLCFECKRAIPKDDKDTRLSLKVTTRKEQLACVNCKHWVETPGSELGYSCTRALFRHCKPYLPGAIPLEKV